MTAPSAPFLAEINFSAVPLGGLSGIGTRSLAAAAVVVYDGYFLSHAQDARLDNPDRYIKYIHKQLQVLIPL